MPALERAFALSEMNDVSVSVGRDLHFDVSRGGDESLDVKVAVGEARQRFSVRGRVTLERFLSSDSATRIPRPPPPAAALSMTGKPTPGAAVARAASRFGAASSLPGKIGESRLRHRACAPPPCR